MTQSNEFGTRLERAENEIIDLKVATSALIETVNLHQNNFEASQRNFALIAAEIKGLRTENRRLLNHLLGEQANDDESEA